ncbi:sigma-70 family RNA polymerase sigma factor [Streptomyces sp. NPDC001584]|uniref:sigma-70 family RNA polymerase sigma factor n=1 Tax=Streptomyces sp. NPDC001584 TaxID=3154521 RepID=UPI00331D0AC3
MAGAERRAIEAELPSVIERLKRGASPAGVVSRQAFALEAARLGLTTDEQQRRLRNGLGVLGFHVRAKRRTPDVRPAARPVASPALGDVEGRPPRIAAPESEPVPSEAARRLAQARRMLARYAEADGTISKLAHDGVVRLHGLGPAGARELAVDFPITRPRPLGAAALSGALGRSGPPVAAAGARRSALTDVSAQDEVLADAVRAARAVLEADRWRRSPGACVLKAEEEVGLAVLLRGGVGALGRDVPAKEVASFPPGGEQRRAHECLVLHNVRLVWKIAQGYQGRGLDIEDIVQHGTIGLMRAVRRFDATKGYKFSTYATWWVKQAMTRAIADEGTLIRLPAYVREKVSKVAAAERKLLGQGRPMTVDNVAYATGLTFAQVEEVRRISRPTDSLDRIIGDDIALGDLITGPSRLPGPLAVVIRKEFQARIRHVLEHLAEREQHVLVRRTGLDGDETDTLEDLGVVFGVTRERIRQVESKAKAKFRGQLIRHRMLPSHL